MMHRVHMPPSKSANLMTVSRDCQNHSNLFRKAFAIHRESSAMKTGTALKHARALLYTAQTQHQKLKIQCPQWSQWKPASCKSALPAQAKPSATTKPKL